MPVKFITVSKGGQTKEITLDELPRYESEGWSTSGTERVYTETGEKTISTQEALTSPDVEGFVSEDEIRARRGNEFREERYGDRGAEAFGIGALGTASFGLLDPAFEELAAWTEGDPGAVAETVKANRGAYGAGSVVGAIGSSLIPGTSALRFAPAALAARGATAAGKAVKGGKAAQLAVEGAIEGGLFAAGSAYADAVLTDSPVTAEKIVGNMASDALLGGVTGGLIGGAVGKLSKRIDAKKAAKVAKQVPEEQASLVRKVLSDADSTAKSFTQVTDDAGKLATKGKIDTLTKAEFDDILADPMTRRIIEEGVGPDATLPKYKKWVGEEIGKLEKANEQVQTIGEKMLSGKATAPEVNKFLDAYGQIDTLSERIVVKHAVTAPPPNTKTLTRLGPDELPQELMKESLSEVAGLEGVNMEVLQNATPEAQLAVRAWAAQAAKETVEKANPIKQAAGTGLAALAGSVGGYPGAALGVLSRHLGNATTRIADGVESFVKFAGKPRKGTVPGIVTGLSKISYATGQELPEYSKAETQGLTKRQRAFKDRARELNAIAMNPEPMKVNIHDKFGPMYSMNMNLADMLTAKAIQRVQFLQSLVPKNPMEGRSPFVEARWVPSNTEIDKFERIAVAADNPYIILDQMNAGRLTQEAVDTVQQLYPEVMHEIRMGFVNRADDLKKNSSYAQRLQLSILFQAPTDVVLEPSFIQKMQGNYLAREQEQAQETGNYSTPGSLQSSLTNTQTATQRLQSK